MQDHLKRYLDQCLEAMPQGAVNRLTWRAEVKRVLLEYVGWCSVEGVRPVQAAELLAGVLQVAPGSFVAYYPGQADLILGVRFKSPYSAFKSKL